MGKCCVLDCSSQGTRGFHVFPANEKVKREWVRWTKTFHFSRKELLENTVCSNHFSGSDRFIDMNGKNCVRSGAIPCLLPPPNLNLKTEHNYAWNSGSIRRRQIPRPMSKKKMIAMTKAILQNDPIVNNVGNEVEVTIDVKTGESAQEVNLDALHMLREATNRIKMLEDKLLQKSKVIDAMKKNQKNLKKVKQQRQILKNTKKNDAVMMKYLEDKNFNNQQLDFWKMQIQNSNKKANAYRYTDDQKSLALAIYKQSPKAYRFMQRIFILPCKRTIGRHSAKIIFESGIDRTFFDFIKENVKTMSVVDTYCTIAWDEMALKSNLDYNATTDSIDGFVELAAQRRPQFATHSLTFMVRGINAPYKQTIAYFYTDGLSSIELAALIKLVTEAVLGTGLQVIGSICDQVGINVAAVHILIYNDFSSRSSDGRLLKYEIGGRSIYHCYDPPHLIKVMRNNLLNKDLRHFVSNRWDVSSSNTIEETKTKLASWTHISSIYHNDTGLYRRLPKITSEHIKPDRLKMKVSVATQVFSATFGTVIIDSCSKKQSPEEFLGTAEILLFFNDLFDSINGSNHPQNKTLKGSVNESSLHFAFWDYALEMLTKMDFITKSTGNVNNSSTVLKKFESTIRGYAEITKICLNANVINVSIRNTNQDGLERSFGCVKSCSQNSKAPIPMHFRTSYATMNVNNLTDSNSLATNCEKDSTVPLLNKLHAFCLNHKEDRSNQSRLDDDQIDVIEIIGFNPEFNESEFQVDHNQNDTFEAVVFDPQFCESERSKLITENTSFVLNSILKKLLKVMACENCIRSLEMYDNMSYPLAILEEFNKIFCKINAMIPHLCSEKSLKKTLLTHIEDLDMNVGCQEHYKYNTLNVKECFIKYAILLFCRNINSILSGKKTIQDSQNLRDLSDIENQAYKFRQKKKRIGKYTDKFTK